MYTNNTRRNPDESTQPQQRVTQNARDNQKDVCRVTCGKTRTFQNYRNRTCYTGRSRGAFYSHYDDIFSVAEDYENELFERFFDNATLLNLGNVDEFIDTLFRYLRENDNNYKLLCRSNESLFSAKKLCNIACAKLLELCNDNPRCVDKQYLEIEINVFVSGLTFEYIRYCRGSSTATLDELHDYTKQWAKGFTARRSSKY